MKSLILAGLSISLGLFSLISLSLPVAAAAQIPVVVASASKAAACEGLTQVDSNQDCNNKGAGVNDIVGVAVNIISFLAGVAAVIMVVLSGFKYITSGGDPAKVSSAKSSLIYALVGVAVVVVAQVLVHVVVKTTVHAIN